MSEAGRFMSANDEKRPPPETWKWPRYSLRSFFLVITIYAAVGGALMIIVDGEDEVVGTMLGGIVLIWCLVCWHIVRLNRTWFTIGRLLKRKS
jgi:hypothetical protein